MDNIFTHIICRLHNIDTWLKYCQRGHDLNKPANPNAKLYCNIVSRFYCRYEHFISKHAFQAEVCQCVGSLLNFAVDQEHVWTPLNIVSLASSLAFFTPTNTQDNDWLINVLEQLHRRQPQHAPLCQR